MCDESGGSIFLLCFPSTVGLIEELLWRSSTSLEAEMVSLSVSGALNHAKQKKMEDMDSRQWLGEFKDAICCVEDLVGEIKSQAFRCKVEKGKSGICILVKVCNFFSSTITVKEIEDKIEDNLGMLDYVVREEDLFGLRLSETSLVEESDIYGRTRDKLAMFDLFLLLLYDDEGGGNKICVIMGMGGIGTSTLGLRYF